MTFTWSRPDADTYTPSGREFGQILREATHVAIGAHQDDLEIMAIDGILQCYSSPGTCFVGVVVSDGSGSARSGRFASKTDSQMRTIRRAEQRRAAELGRYGAVVQLDFPSEAVKDPKQRQAVERDLTTLLQAASPRVVYTHSLFDAHATHRATALAVVDALRRSDLEHLGAFLGCEVWQDLDWLPDEYRVTMDVSAHPELQLQLLEAFESQVEGGKRYDLATLGRRRAHATFSQSHAIDGATGLLHALDLFPLLGDMDAERYLGLVCDRHKQISLKKVEALG